MTVQIELPEKPVDGYSVKFFQVNFGELWCYIDEYEVRYYQDTTWREYSGKDDGGADLEDQWIWSANGQAQGRSDGWSGLHLERNQNRYLTREEAVVAAKQLCQEAIDRHLQHVLEITNVKNKLR